MYVAEEKGRSKKRNLHAWEHTFLYMWQGWWITNVFCVVRYTIIDGKFILEDLKQGGMQQVKKPEAHIPTEQY